MKICIATGTRAEYGLLKPLIDKLNGEPGIRVQILVTGAHLSPEFGLTYKQIEEDGFTIDYKVEMLLSSDTPEGIVKSMGIGMIGFAEAFKILSPDLLVILGDRYEMLAMASAAIIYKIPIAHIHGGDITEGAYDDAIRHSITKMSHFHFPSTEIYRNRIIQLGEPPESVFNVGAIGIDNILNMPLLGKSELESSLGIHFSKWNYLVAFHPETLSDESVEAQFERLLQALDAVEESFFIFTKSNADTGGRIINQQMAAYVQKHPTKAALFDSLGALRFLSTVKVCDAMIGNSSSGIVEAPSLHTATINIGDRQKGRIQADSVINCEVETEQIIDAIKQTQRPEMKTELQQMSNPYYNGNASTQIANVLKNVDVKRIRPKKFHDL